ncbi:MAG: hypothetical protein AAGA96_11385, partial [Verrucomicrobiota bacterium]
LAFDPRYADVLASMRTKVRARMKAVGDDESLSGEPRLLKDHPLPPALKLYYPNGGERFHPGETVEVRWSEGWKGTDNIKLEYYDGDSWKTIENAVPHDGSYTWEVPSEEATAVHLRIASSDGGIMDESDRPFAIGTVR